MERYSIKQGELFKRGDIFDLESLLKQEATNRTRRDDPITPRYAMSSFHIRADRFLCVI